MDTRKFLFSVFLSAALLESGILLAHGPLQQRIELDAAWERPVRTLSTAPFGQDAFTALAPGHAPASAVFRTRRERQLIVPEGCDEVAALQDSFGRCPEDSGHDAAASAASWPASRYGVVDEERLVARYGAAALFDDLIFPFGHHGGSVDPGDERPHQLPALGRALAGDYLACLRAHRGTGRIKLVVSDLDGTLWPGSAEDDGLDRIDGDATSRWTHPGLHQALSVLKSHVWTTR
ncbi:hypothetical protein [Streptomyces sp. DSM 118148]|uniref:hypothetical protein n=1 Tax=Streptomyces sp. DSM 118148 TaxID=3448667 RepID=UPI0040400C54